MCLLDHRDSMLPHGRDDHVGHVSSDYRNEQEIPTILEERGWTCQYITSTMDQTHTRQFNLYLINANTGQIADDILNRKS